MSQRSDTAQWEKMKCDSRDHSTHQAKTRFPPISLPIYCGTVSRRHLQDKQHANSPTLGSLRDVHSRRLLFAHGSVLNSRHHNKKNAKGVVLFYGTGRDPLSRLSLRAAFISNVRRLCAVLALNPIPIQLVPIRGGKRTWNRE